MARTGLFGGFHFYPEVFSDHMQEQQYLSTAMIASGIVQNDPTIGDLIGSKGNVGTMPFYKPIDGNTDTALNNDGETDNTPILTSDGTQTFMTVGRMKAWKTQDFTREISGTDPLGDVANKVGDYYRQIWQKSLLSTLTGVMAVAGLANHVTNVSITSGTIEDANKIDSTSLLDLSYKSLGDKASAFSLVIMHSAVYNALVKAQLITYDKYTVPGALQSVTLPIYDNKIVIVMDNGTVDTSVPGYPVYSTYMAGAGAFLGFEKQLLRPYYLDYDPETTAGVEKFYTKQTRVLHPNGLSISADNIAKESPTDAELATSGNWALKFNEKNIHLALLKTNG